MLDPPVQASLSFSEMSITPPTLGTRTPNLVFWIKVSLNQTAKVLVLTCCGTGFDGGGIVGGGTNLGVVTTGVSLAA
mgnify:CR=1 FL=1